MRVSGWGLAYFSAGLIGLGILSFVYGDFAMQWQPVPPWVPGRPGLAYLSGALLIACGAGLHWSRTAALASRVLFVYVALWLLLLKVPRIVAAPLIEGSWLGAGEIALVVAGGWVLVATLGGTWGGSMLRFASGERGIRLARWLFGLALPAVGLSHFVYAEAAVGLVPAWLPFRMGWAYLAGAGHIAAGLGVLLSVCPRLAATMEAGMITAFTALVWIPQVVGAPTQRLPWTAFFVSWFVGAAAWVVAESYRGAAWLQVGWSAAPRTRHQGHEAVPEQANPV